MAENSVYKGYVVSVNEAESGVDEPIGVAASSSSDALTSSNSDNNSPRKSPREFINGAIQLDEFTLPTFDDKNVPYSAFSYDTNKNSQTDFQNKADNRQEQFQSQDESDFRIVKEKRKNYRFYELFRYADWLDILLMVGGIILALAQGAALPGALFIYAKILNAMITHNPCWDQIKAQLGNSSSANVSLAHLPAHLTSGQTLFETVGPQCGWYALIGVGIFLGGVLHSTAWTIAGERQIYRIRVRLFKAILSKDAGWFDQRRTGALNHVLFEMIRKMEDGMTAKVSITVSWLGTAIAGFIIAFVSDWLVSIVTCSLVPLLFIISFVMIRLIRNYTTKQSEAYREAGSIAGEVISNWRTVLAFNKQEYEVKRYGTYLRSCKRMGTLKTITSGASQGLIYLVTYSMAGLAFWWGNSSQVGQEGGTVMQVILCIMIGTMSLGNASPNFENFAAALGAADEVYQIIDEKSLIDNFEPTGTWVEKLRGDLCLENVSFTYPTRPDRPVLQSISLTIPRGKTVALVGPSGCGKSTIVQLLLRYYDAAGGKLTVDDVDIRDLNVRWFRQQIGLVSQEPILFNTTIRDNIRLGAVDQAVVSDDDIIAACRLSNAHDFIMRLPMGYDTMVGERGAQLSGGQKQRIAIARALISNPRILVLDEATSALDTSSEKVVQEALDKARVGRTTLVIAHRLSTIRNADMIAVVDQGKIVELGTHDHLIEREGLYFRLVESQQRAAELGTGSPLNGSELDLTNDLHYLIDENAKTNDSFNTSLNSSGTRPQVQRLNSNISTSSKGKGAGKLEGARRPSIGLTGLERGESIDRSLKDSTGEELNRFQLMATVLGWGKPELGLTILCAFVSILTGGIQPSYGVVVTEFVSSFCPGGDDSKFKMLLGIVIMLGVVQVILLTAQHALFAAIGERLTARMRCRLLGKILRMDAGWLDREENQPSILTTVLATDCIDIQGISGVRIGVYLSAAVIVGAAVIYSLILDYRVALALIGIMPLVVVAAVTYARVSYGTAREGETESKENAIIAMDAIGNMRTVMALAAEPYFLEQFSKRFVAIRNRTIKTGIAASPLFSFTMAAIAWAGAITFSLGSYLMDHGETTFLKVIRIYVLITFCGFAIGRSSTAIPEEDDARKSAVKIKRIIEVQNTIDTEDPLTGESLAAKQLEEDKSLQARRCAGRIEFKNVVFNYPTRPGVQVLSELNFTIEPGQCVALCGPSGGGKSTVIQLLQRLYDPKSGAVYIDGVDIRSANVRWLRGVIGLVSQEPVLFGLSIAENVAYGSRTEASPDLQEIESACKFANAIDFIEYFPDRFDTQVGERGAQLSGGQKQRLAIARALVRNPAVLLLDEATSALDTESERVVQEALDVAEEGRTSVVIAHRLSTIQSADKIVCIENGKVVEEGTHLELMHQRGTYYKLQQFQSSKQLPDIQENDVF